jgi:hypothetical protein
MATSTPWGASQGKKKHIHGVNTYWTAGHGGISVSRKLAEKRLSKYALQRGIFMNNSYWFEEDCDWAFVPYEIPEVMEAMNKEAKERGSDFILSKEYLREAIVRWNESYEG